MTIVVVVYLDMHLPQVMHTWFLEIAIVQDVGIQACVCVCIRVCAHVCLPCVSYNTGKSALYIRTMYEGTQYQRTITLYIRKSTSACIIKDTV